jgi:hypothetical protein
MISKNQTKFAVGQHITFEGFNGPIQGEIIEIIKPGEDVSRVRPGYCADEDKFYQNDILVIAGNSWYARANAKHGIYNCVSVNAHIELLHPI